jgi:hypothetical protein
MADEDAEFIASTRRSRRRLIALGIAGGALVAGGAVLLVVGATGSLGVDEPAASDASATLEVEEVERAAREAARDQARSRLGAACDAERADEALGDLATEDDWDGVLLVALEWETRCPADQQVRWRVFKAYEELERWKEAEATASQLIAMDPADVDYWWWRGQARKELGDLEESASDYRQAIALSTLERSNGVHTAGLLEVVPAIGRPCEGVFAMRWYAARNEGEINRWAEDKLRSTSEFGTCEQAVGRGSASLRTGAPVELRITGGKPIAAVIDLHMAYVVVDAATAAATQLVLGAATVDIAIGGKTQVARLARGTIQVGSMEANEVDVAIVEADLPRPIVGLSFLWRFDVSEESGKLAFEPIADPGEI